MTAAVTSLLTARQRRILEFIRAHHAEHGYAPSLRDIGAAVGLSSPGSVRYQIDQLVRQGWIRRTPDTPRSLVVLNPTDGTDS